MSARRRQRGQVMIILFAALLFGGSITAGVIAVGKPLKSLRKEVKAMEFRQANKDAVLAILKQWEDISEATNKAYGKRTRALTDLMRDQSTTRADFERFFAAQRADIATGVEQIVSLRSELRAALSREEWDALMRPQSAK